MANQNSASMRFIFMTVFLDALGLGLVIPILPDLFRQFTQDSTEISHLYGYFVAVYALMQFLASPVLGALSDRFGRRPVLLISILGSAADYLIMASALNIWVLFLGRIFSGLTGANFSVANAYVADVSNDKNRSANFGIVGAAFGVGFIVGPALGGLLSSFGIATAFIVAAGLNFLNFLFGYFILPESLLKENRRKVRLKALNPFLVLRHVLKKSAVVHLIWATVILHLAGQIHPSNWTLYTQEKFGWTAVDVGVSISFVGIAITLVQGVLTRYLVPWLGEWKSLNYGVALNAIGFTAIAFATHGWMMYVIAGVWSLSQVAFPAVQSIITAQVPANEQGEVQGSLSGLASLMGAMGPLVYSGLFAHFTSATAPVYFPGAAYLLAGLIGASAGIVLLIFRKNR